MVSLAHFKSAVHDRLKEGGRTANVQHGPSLRGCGAVRCSGLRPCCWSHSWLIGAYSFLKLVAAIFTRLGTPMHSEAEAGVLLKTSQGRYSAARCLGPAGALADKPGST